MATTGIFLKREEEDRRTLGTFYAMMVQAVLLFGYKTWVLTPRFEKALKGFHHWSVGRMACMGPKHQRDRTWVYISIGAALEMVGLEETRVYIACHQNTVAHYIATRSIMYLCPVTERNTGLCLSRR